MTSQQSIGEYHKLSLLDEAVVLYHSIGEDFIKLLDLYINVQDGQEKYTFIGPDYLILGHVDKDDKGRYWHVSYAAHRKPEKTIHLFLELAPFQLDRVRFCRYHNMNTDKYYSWKSLKRISKYGLITKSSTATSTAATTSAGSSSNSGC
tara:strand:+ start:2414 stop:2860 length:447 start_codon:yes stop_codon:yes gene_type:complete